MKKLIEKYLNKHSFIISLFFIYFIVSIFCKYVFFQFYSDYDGAPLLTPVNINMYLCTFFSVLSIFSVFLLIYNKRIKGIMFLFNIFLSIFLIANIIYYKYFQNPISIQIFYSLKQIGDTMGGTKALFNPLDLILLLDIPLYLFFFKWYNKKFQKSHKLSKKKFFIAFPLLIISILGFNFLYNNFEKPQFIYDNNYIVSKFGLAYFNLHDIKTFVSTAFVDNKLTLTEKNILKNLYASKVPTANVYTASGKGKNLIIIQMESMQNCLINAKINGVEVTPNLNKYIKENIYFSNFYRQTAAGNTSDAEFLTNTSLFPMANSMVYFSHPLNTYYSLPKLMQGQGYKTYVSHAYTASFYNRATAYNSLGFDKFFSKNDFKEDETIGWGLSDKSFFKQTLSKINTSEPFYSFLITLSSHYPFDAFNDYKFNVGKYEKTLVGNYIKGINYLDSSLGELFADLKKRGLYDNSVIAMYGDHAGIPADHATELLDILNKPINEAEILKLQRIPLILHIPGKKTIINDKVGGQLNTLPTIANIMGFKAIYALGEDLFDNNFKGSAILVGGTVITKDYLYVANLDSVFDNKGNLLSKGKYIKDIEKKRKILNYSEIIVTKDIFRKASSFMQN